MKDTKASKKTGTNAFRGICSCFRSCILRLGLFLKWLLLGILTGAVVGIAGSGFSLLLAKANAWRSACPQIVIALPAAGLLIVLLYRLLRDENDGGTNMVIASVSGAPELPPQMAPLIFVSTFLTQLCGGSAGREGAALQLGGSLAATLGRLLPLPKDSRRTMILCGMSAGFTALFGTPLAASVFVLEVIHVGTMQYASLLPCVTASFTAAFIARACGCHADAFPVAALPSADPQSLLLVLIPGIAAAAAGILFCTVSHVTERACRRLAPNPYLRVLAGGCLILLLGALLRTDRYFGSGASLIEEAFLKESFPWYVFLLKILFTALTLGCGYKGGEIVPALCIGASLGTALAPLLPLPGPLVTACAMTGVFCAVTNCPLASLLIALELFGCEGMPFYLVVVAVSYTVSGRCSLYHTQRFSSCS